MKKIIPLCIGFFVFGILFYNYAPRTTTIHAEFPLYNINELVDSSDLILYGEVVKINESKWSNPNKIYGEYIRNDISTDYIIKVKKIYHGQIVEKEISVRTFVGTVAEETWISDDYPSFTEGEEALLFLRVPNPLYEPTNEDYYLPVGMLQGKFSKKNDIKTVDEIFENRIIKKEFHLSTIEKEIKDILKDLEKNPIIKYSSDEVEEINKAIYKNDNN